MQEYSLTKHDFKKELECKAEKVEAHMSVTHDTTEKHIVRLKVLEGEVENKTLDIVDIVDRPRSSRKKLDGVNSQNKALSQFKPDLRTAIAISEEQDKNISKMKTAIKCLEKCYICHMKIQ